MDCYQWFSPWEEAEKAQREVAMANDRAAHAREQGRQDIIRLEERSGAGFLRHVIEGQAYKVAEHFVHEQIRPHLQTAWHELRRRDMARELIDLTPLRATIAHTDSQVISPVYPDEMEARKIMLRTVVYVRPAQYAIQEAVY